MDYQTTEIFSQFIIESRCFNFHFHPIQILVCFHLSSNRRCRTCLIDSSIFLHVNFNLRYYRPLIDYRANFATHWWEKSNWKQNKNYNWRNFWNVLTSSDYIHHIQLSVSICRWRKCKIYVDHWDSAEEKDNAQLKILNPYREFWGCFKALKHQKKFMQLLCNNLCRLFLSFSIFPVCRACAAKKNSRRRNLRRTEMKTERRWRVAMIWRVENLLSLRVAF